MPRESNKDKLAERQDVTAPFLFDDAEMPVLLPVLESIKARRYEHTGEGLLADDKLAFRLVELICLKWGVKKISREMCISVHTVRAAKRALVAQGKLAPYKQRVVELFEEIVELGASNYLEALENKLVPAGQIPVGLGIISDKRALQLGEATSIRSDAVQTEDITERALNAYLEKLPRANSDSVSMGNAEEPKQIAGNGVADAGLDAGASRRTDTGEDTGTKPEPPPNAAGGGGGGLDGAGAG